MDDALQKVQARIAELPPDVRQAIEAADLDVRVQEIGKKHQLHIDQIGKLQNEVLLVMLGFTDTNDFIGNVTMHAAVSSEAAAAIATDINAGILNPIRESLKKFAEQHGNVSQTPSPAANAAPAPAASAPSAPKPINASPSLIASASKPVVPLAPHPHDLMLVEKTVTTPAKTVPAIPTPAQTAAPIPPAPPKPADYKTDPYREPVEP